MRTVMRVFVCLVAGTGFVPSASAFTDGEARCRDTIAQAVERYAAAVSSAVVRCNQRRSSGEAPLDTNCYDAIEMDFEGELLLAKEEQRLAVATGCTGAESLLTTIHPSCPAPAGSVDDLGPTTGIDDFTEAADCVLALTETHFLAMLADVQGTPDAVLLRPMWRCQRKLGTGASRLATTQLAESRRCQELADAAGGSAYFSCAGVDPRARVARVKARYERRIPLACGTLDPGVSVLDACSREMSQLMGCTEASAGTHGDALIALAYAFAEDPSATTTTLPSE